jgi:CRISPR-associated protein Cas2
MSVKGDSIFMRLFLFFDLPVTTKKQRAIAAKFRKTLINDGYFMLQFSVYCRICRGHEVVEKMMRHLQNHVPPEGNVRVLQVTDNQYANMKLLVGTPEKEEIMGTNQLVFF